MKRSFVFVLAAGLLGGVLAAAIPQTKPLKNEATVFTSDYVRIAVVRPTWWGDSGAAQYLRIAATEDDLNNNNIANIKHVDVESYVNDTYYKKYFGAAPDGVFNEYSTDGIIFYDVTLADISGKYFDLARIDPDSGKTTVWNRTSESSVELFNESMLHKVWRIWNDGKGIHRPEGNSAESRNVSNQAISSLLYGYLTCSSSTANGYGAFNALNTNFNLLGRVFADTDTILDFADEADYAIGRGDGATVKTADKIAMMNALSSGSPSNFTPMFDDKKNLTALIALGLLSIASVGFFYFRNKKKMKA